MVQGIGNSNGSVYWKQQTVINIKLVWNSFVVDLPKQRWLFGKKQPWISFHANTQIEKFHSNALQHLIYLLDEFDIIKFLVHVNLSANSKKLNANCMQRESLLFLPIFLYTLLITHKKGYIPKRKSIYTT